MKYALKNAMKLSLADSDNFNISFTVLFNIILNVNVDLLRQMTFCPLYKHSKLGIVKLVI